MNHSASPLGHTARGLALALLAIPLAGAQPTPHAGTTLKPDPTHPRLAWTVVLNSFPPRLSLVDDRTHALLGVRSTHPSDGAYAMNVELSPDGRFAYVMHGDNSITRLDLLAPALPPVQISPDPSLITPGFAVTMRDLEISADGRYLVATGCNVGAWQFSVPVPRNRVSIYDLQIPGASAHFFVDTVFNDLFPAELEIAIDDQNRAFVSDGEYQSNVMVDLATQTIAGLFKSSDNDSLSIPTGGTGSGPPLPCGAIGMTSAGATWIAFQTLTGHGVLRAPLFATGGVQDDEFPGFDSREVETRPGTRFVALSRPKSAALVGPSPDQIVLVDPASGATTATVKLAGWHRFREIEFLRDFENARVYGIDWGANLLLTANAADWLVDPSVAEIPLVTVSIPVATFRFRQTSDGLVSDMGRYVVHDAKGRLAYFALAQHAALLAVVDLLPGIVDRESVDLEISGQVRCHQD